EHGKEEEPTRHVQTPRRNQPVGARLDEQVPRRVQDGGAQREDSGRGQNEGSVVVAGVEIDAGDAFGPEHLDVATVVFDREAEVEAVPAELLDRQPLEVARDLEV